jgi:ABC-type antimicrobial peptide transport system permease subunit
MQRRSVQAMFIVESFSLGLIAGVAGAILGAVVCLGVNALGIQVPEAAQLFLMSNRLGLEVTPGVLVGAVAGISACTALVSILPSYLAARLKPITAMHHVG